MLFTDPNIFLPPLLLHSSKIIHGTVVTLSPSGQPFLPLSFVVGFLSFVCGFPKLGHTISTNGFTWFRCVFFWCLPFSSSIFHFWPCRMPFFPLSPFFFRLFLSLNLDENPSSTVSSNARRPSQWATFYLPVSLLGDFSEAMVSSCSLLS